MNAESPFSSVHSQRFLLVTDAWRQNLNRLADGFGDREPFLLVTGESGMGKTSLVLHAVAEWSPHARVATVTNPALTRNELLEEIAIRFGGHPAPGASKPQVLACLTNVFAEAAAQGQVPALVVEDAHQLDAELLEELRLLASNESQAQRRFEIVLVGLPALEDRLAAPELAALHQRVAVHCRVVPLTPKETRNYLHHRMGAVERDGSLFPRRTCNEIHERTLGVPRAINLLAAEAMRRAAGHGGKTVTPEIVRAAAITLWGAPARDTATADGAENGAEEPAPAAPVADAGTDETPEPVAVAPPPVAIAPDPPAPPAFEDTRGAAGTEAPSGPEPSAEAVARETAAPPTATSGADDAGVEAMTVEARDAAAPAGSESSPSASDPGSGVVPPDSIAAKASDPRVRDWVTRFVGDQGPPRIGSALELERLVQLDESEGPAPRVSRTVPADWDETPAAPDDLPEPRRTPVQPPFEMHSRHARRGGLNPATLVIAVVVFAGLGIALTIARDQLLGPWGTPSTPASGGATSPPPAPAPAPASTDTMPSMVESAPAPETAPVPIVDSVTVNGSEAQIVSSSPRIETRAAAPPHADVSSKWYALQVGTYLAQERALDERDRIANAVGTNAWVVRDGESGAATYHVVLGAYSTATRAEDAAVALLDRGLVSEARVVPLPPRRLRR